MEKGDFNFGSTDSEIISEVLSENSNTKICELTKNIKQVSIPTTLNHHLDSKTEISQHQISSSQI